MSIETEQNKSISLIYKYVCTVKWILNMDNSNVTKTVSMWVVLGFVAKLFSFKVFKSNGNINEHILNLDFICIFKPAGE